jgi:uncharacterized protein YdhG (YjbR/CyaY superfamily)
MSSTKGSAEIDAYLGGLPDAQRASLQHLRETIRAAAPEATEALVYGVPGFKLGGKSLVGYAGFTNHCGFYPMSPDVIAAHADALERFETAKGTVRFKPEDPLSDALVIKLVKARIAEIEDVQT